VVKRGGGRKRGRPVTLSAEEKLKNDREKWRRKKANQRKKDYDAEWLRKTENGYIETLEVLHWNTMIEVLVSDGWLDERDINTTARLSEAVDGYFASVAFRAESGKRNRRTLGDVRGTVRVKITPELIDGFISSKWERSDEREELLVPARPVIYVANYYAGDDLHLKIHEARMKVNSFRTRPTSYTHQGRLQLAMMETELQDLVDKQARLRANAWNRMHEDYVSLPEMPDEFANRLRGNRRAIKEFAEAYLCNYYLSHIPEPPSFPCNCKLALPECDCLSRFRHKVYEGALDGPPKPKRPQAGKVIQKKSLYSEKQPRWWRDGRYSTSKRHDTDTIKSHDKSASVGMKGFHAGTKGVWRTENAVYYPERDDRASTRDWNKTAREGERALQRPYDDVEGTPKSWSNPSDADPDNDDHITRIGRRVIEETLIEPKREREDDD